MIVLTVLIVAVVLGLVIGQFLTVTATLFLGIFIASVVLGIVGALANAIYWKRNPNGYVYGLLGRRQRRHRWY